MRTRVREQVRPEGSAGQAQAPGQDSPALRDSTTWRWTAPLTAEDTALPGRMLMLLSRLHRSELQRQAEAHAPSAGA
ncbi:hypothetical protein VQ02_01795 [Methylobacterium variabile]|jgi:hypothetical protein|uniref:Uncharacterized protein n=1 Tax=Methylobacterium variabile TaxID=298794 RepID=A0A0J6T632_9HYPH|nr:hypothetical protein VQ02_01795 [Methylobacterium variabile]